MTQTVIVTLVALAALAVVVRKLIGALMPTKAGTCPSCANSDACGSTQPAAPAAQSPERAYPLTFVRKS